MPGTDIGIEADDPLAVGAFQMQPGEQALPVELRILAVELVDVLDDQAAVAMAFEFADFGAAQWAGAVVVERILVHGIGYVLNWLLYQISFAGLKTVASTCYSMYPDKTLAQSGLRFI